MIEIVDALLFVQDVGDISGRCGDSNAGDWLCPNSASNLCICPGKTSIMYVHDNALPAVN